MSETEGCAPAQGIGSPQRVVLDMDSVEVRDHGR